MKDWGHQTRANTKAGMKPGFGYFHEMGTGKTKTFIDKCREHMNRERQLMRILIFTPPMVVPQFRDEWLKFSKIDPKMITILRGSGAKRLKLFNQRAFKADGTPTPHIFITNYESLTMGAKRDPKRRTYTPGELYQAFERWAPQILGFDEGHRLKSPEADRSKLAARLANPYAEGKALPKPFTYVLTGTPILNDPLDVFQPFKIMLGGFPTPAYIQGLGQDPTKLIENYFAFRARYFRDRNSTMPKERYFPRWEVMTVQKDGIDGMAEITQMMDAYSDRVTKAECLDLPPEVAITRKVAMAPDQAKSYKEMKNLLVTTLNDRTCVAKLAITKALRLLQITAGFVSVAGQGDEMDPADIRFKNTPKLEALEELLTELTPNHKVLVWAVWKDNYAEIRDLLDKLKIGFVEAHGGVSEGAKREAVKRFQLDSSVRVFFGHPGSGGIGLNLVQASYSIFYSRTFSLEHYLQARSRNHRGGADIHEKITHYDLVCEGTIDELALEALAAKRQIGEKMLGDIANALAQQVPAEY